MSKVMNVAICLDLVFRSGLVHFFFFWLRGIKRMDLISGIGWFFFIIILFG